jgi:enterochelin esterase-like enzyme
VPLGRIGVAGAVAAGALTLVSGARAALLPPSWTEIQTGPDGGAVWQGVIPNRYVAGATRPSVVYVPPDAGSGGRYPVMYLLHGLPGSPYSFVDGLRLASIADRLIVAGRVRPFIAVMPSANTAVLYKGEWTGARESFLVDNVVPWVDAHLPTIPSARGRSIAGLSAGGYGAIDIGLRHAGLFGVLESWSGYFRATVSADDPSLLVERKAALLRRLGTRFFLSCGSTTDGATARLAHAYAEELSTLRLSHELFLAPGGHNGRFWRLQLPRALEFALRPPTSPAARA